MLQLDPVSLILANGLMSLAMTAILLVSRLGLGAEGRGICSWVLGDLLASLGRLSALATVAGVAALADPNFPALTSTCFLLAAAGHAIALRRAGGRADRPVHAWGAVFGAGVVFYTVVSHTDWMPDRRLWITAAEACGALVTLSALRPLLRCWGGRLIAAMTCVVIAISVVIAAASLLGGEPGGIVPPRNGVRPIVVMVDIVISLFISGGFLLLLQERLRARVETLMVTDALTGTFNRRGLMPQLRQALAQLQRSGRPMSVVMFDLDHFKRVNDLHGHAVGDRVLAGFAARVKAELRGGDALGRWGGEEFLLLLPDTALAGAVTKAECLRELVAGEAVADGVPRVTVSGGVAALDAQGCGGDPERTLAQLLCQADERLYLAKQRRNRVVGGEAKACADEQPAEQAHRIDAEPRAPAESSGSPFRHADLDLQARTRPTPVRAATGPRSRPSDADRVSAPNAEIKTEQVHGHSP